MSLKEDYGKDLRKRYPNVPEHALPVKKFVDKTANGLTTMILERCRLSNVFARRISSEGRYRPGDEVVDTLGRRRVMKGVWLPGLNTGLPDIFLIIRGKFIGVEVKVGKDRQSDVQKDVQQQIESAGGTYLIIKTFEQFEQFLKTKIK